jgi:hypothetical protein
MSTLLSALLLADAVEKFNPDQERDESGRWAADAMSDKARESSKEAAAKNTPAAHTAAAQAHWDALYAHMEASNRAAPAGVSRPVNVARESEHRKAAMLHEQTAAKLSSGKKSARRK